MLRAYSLALAAVLFLVSGCGDEYEQVDYDKPEKPAEVVIDVAHVDLEKDNVPKAFATPSLKPDAPVLFKGSINPPSEPLRPFTVQVRFLRERPGRKPVTMRNKSQRLTEEGERLTYEVQLDAPRSPGTYTTELTCTVVNTEDQTRERREIARSTVRVK